MHCSELIQRNNGYDAGYAKDEYDCNLDKCQCAHFDGAIIGKLKMFSILFKQMLRRYCSIRTDCPQVDQFY